MRKRLRLANSKRLFARERETVDKAFAGDVVGIVGNYDFQIGDTLAEEAGVTFDEMPRFAPETFAFLHNVTTSNFKRFREGLSQLLKEGVAQSYELADSPVRVPLLGAVGSLQFDVLQYRLETEYGAPTRLEPASWSIARWVAAKVDGANGAGESTVPLRPKLLLPTGSVLAQDSRGAWVVLLPSDWTARYFEEKNSDVQVSAIPL